MLKKRRSASSWKQIRYPYPLLLFLFSSLAFFSFFFFWWATFACLVFWYSALDFDQIIIFAQSINLPNTVIRILLYIFFFLLVHLWLFPIIIDYFLMIYWFVTTTRKNTVLYYDISHIKKQTYTIYNKCQLILNYRLKKC